MNDYTKRQTIPRTALGILYQIYMSMYYAFIHAFKEKIPFKLRTEDISYGDFDDLVVILPTGVTAIQLKHRKEVSESNADSEKLIQYDFSDFIAKSGNKHKLSFYSYFDSLFEKLSTNNFTDHTFQFLSNYKLPSELKNCIELGKFKDDFFSSNELKIWVTRNLIIASIEQHSESIKEVARLDTQQYASFLIKFLQLAAYTETEKYVTAELKKALFGFIKDNFQLNKRSFKEHEKENILRDKLKAFAEGTSTLTKKQRKELKKLLKYKYVYANLSVDSLALANFSINKDTIEKFLKVLSFKFGQSNINKLQEEIQGILAEKFNITNNALFYAFFYEFYQWLISPQAKTLDGDEVRNLFEQWYNQYIHLERLSGLTQVNLQKIGDLATEHQFSRQSEETYIKNFIQSKSINVLAIVGEPGIGKSSVTKKVLGELKFIDGKYLFLDIREFSQFIHHAKQPFNLSHLKALELICLDNAEFSVDNQKIIPEYCELFDNIIQQGKKLVLLYRKVPWQAIENNFIEDYPDHKKLIVKRIKLQDILTHYFFLQPLLNQRIIPKDGEEIGAIEFKESFHRKISKLLRVPFYLNIIIKHYRIILSLDDQLESLQQHIINIAITRPTTNKSAQEKNPVAKERKTVLRELVFAKSKANTPHGIIAVRNRESIIDSLVKDGILLKGDEDNSYNFSHLLYEDFMVAEAIKIFCNEWLEAQDDPKYLLKTLQRNLPSYKKFTWANNLNLSAELGQLLKYKYSDSYYNQSSNCDNLLLIAIMTHDQKFLQLVKPLVNGLNYSLSDDNLENTTFLGSAIMAQNIEAVSFLLKSGAGVYFDAYDRNFEDDDAFSSIPHDEDEMRAQYEALSDDENNWDVYFDHGSSSDKYYEIRPYKYIFREGRQNAYAEEMEIDYHGLKHIPSSAFFNHDKNQHKNHYLIRHIFEAAETGNRELLRLVIKYATPDWENVHYENALHLAVLKQRPILVEELINADFKIDKVDYDRETLLHNAIYCSTYTAENRQAYYSKEVSYTIFNLVLTAYLRQKISLNQQNVVGWTPLHLAILMYDQCMIANLALHGAKRDIKDNQGYTAEALLKKVNKYTGLKLFFEISTSDPIVDSSQRKLSEFFEPRKFASKKRKLEGDSALARPAKQVKVAQTAPGSNLTSTASGGLFGLHAKQAQANESWYDSEQMQLLLQHYLRNYGNVQIITPIDAYQLSGQTLEDNLQDSLLQSIMTESVTGHSSFDTVVAPLNLGNRHWVALYIYYDSRDRTRPTVGYFDPYGERMPLFMANAIKRVYTGLQADAILESPIQLQTDGFNCGPWVIAIINSLVQSNKLPAEDFDISQQRREDAEVLASDTQLAAKRL